MCIRDRREADAADIVDEALALAARGKIDGDDPLDRVRHLLGSEAGAQNLADRGILGGVAAKRDLVGFDAALLQAENADMADMVVAAGIDAAGDLDAERSDLCLLYTSRCV